MLNSGVCLFRSHLLCPMETSVVYTKGPKYDDFHSTLRKPSELCPVVFITLTLNISFKEADLNRSVTECIIKYFRKSLS